MKLIAAVVVAASVVLAPALSAGVFDPPQGNKQVQPGVKNHAGKHQGKKHRAAKRHHMKMMKKHHHQKGGKGQGKN